MIVNQKKNQKQQTIKITKVIGSKGIGTKIITIQHAELISKWIIHYKYGQVEQFIRIQSFIL